MYYLLYIIGIPKWCPFKGQLLTTVIAFVSELCLQPILSLRFGSEVLAKPAPIYPT